MFDDTGRFPPVETNHAWNAVKIDHDQWKLIDCCWGAGNVNEGVNLGTRARRLISRFTEMLILSSLLPKFVSPAREDFTALRTLRPAHFFRADGRARQS